ncbi:MAG: class I SAM-dependent methyltransferase [Desulfarculaceae bacterium]|nr:class I SAM-dependent methyltransferase [Desulfarculaceae bacterium]MCF8047305.1 class I SAM-dependent methyltransferase [Desulfarculaceae bacterium]MCF8066887.1 class I SAM-dependent methyltransferase [Desulfarculaceae bacterium]MCF8098562.1 class I SAM-dependent methyltransferase [Desulfarculaceae bacterium]MCF8121731.1 class I SAM-dependent methyltransferase [Desulfarculaceae bacterium]
MANEHVCPWWMIHTFDNPVRRLFHNPEAMLGPYLHADTRAADIGCGIGFFSIGMARLVGGSGRVFAMDLQEKMLAGVERRARKAGLSGRIETRKVEANDLAAPDLKGSLDLVLAFWMLHEVPDQERFLGQVKELLKPGGLFYLAEPRMHVKARDFDGSLALAGELGMRLMERPEVRLSRGAVLAA